MEATTLFDDTEGILHSTEEHIIVIYKSGEGS